MLFSHRLQQSGDGSRIHLGLFVSFRATPGIRLRVGSESTVLRYHARDFVPRRLTQVSYSLLGKGISKLIAKLGQALNFDPRWLSRNKNPYPCTPPSNGWIERQPTHSASTCIRSNHRDAISPCWLQGCAFPHVWSHFGEVSGAMLSSSATMASSRCSSAGVSSCRRSRMSARPISGRRPNNRPICREGPDW